MGCYSCGRGFHSECINSNCGACHPDVEHVYKSLATVGGNHGRQLGAPVKDPENVKDRHSTGRKRAAQLYHIFHGAFCEWRMKKNCGGGEKPITGCLAGKQEARHHGPVKDTLRNEPGNVHRICTLCHNRWHADNDPIYNEEEYDKTIHDPQPAEELELLANAAYWKVKQ